MLGPDLVRARRRGDALELQKFPEKERLRAVEIAEQLLALLGSVEGASWDEVSEALGLVLRASKEEKLWAGLKKLLLDACEFGAPAAVDAVALRQALFLRASQARAALELGAPFDRAAVVEAVSAEFGINAEVAEEALFSDLKGAARLTALPQLSPEDLVERYELAQLQGVLLRAVSLRAVVRSTHPEDYRALFHKLKFRQLLYRITPLPEGRFQLDIDGPFSVLEATTKYGLALALLVPALFACDEVELSAEVRWGKERKALTFESKLKKRAWGSNELAYASLGLRPELEALVEALDKKPSGFTVTRASALLDVPGVGLVVPDLCFQAPGAPPVYLELLGYWSREAVWKRVEWAEAQRDCRVLFAVSSRLRVSEAVLDEGASSALYVFKGTLSPRAVLERVISLSARP